MRYANRRDANDAEIIDYVLALGYWTWKADPPAPFDYIVGRGSNPTVVFLEIKTKLGKLTGNQVNFKKLARTFTEARTPEEARAGIEKWI